MARVILVPFSISEITVMDIFNEYSPFQRTHALPTRRTYNIFGSEIDRMLSMISGWDGVIIINSMKPVVYPSVISSRNVWCGDDKWKLKTAGQTIFHQWMMIVDGYVALVTCRSGSFCRFVLEIDFFLTLKTSVSSWRPWTWFAVICKVKSHVCHFFLLGSQR